MVEQKPTKLQEKPVSTLNSLPPGGQLDGRITPTRQEGRVTPTVPQSPPITIGQILSLIADAEKLIDYVSLHVFYFDGSCTLYLPMPLLRPSSDSQCHYVSRVMRKPVQAICEQQRRRSVCASVQSDQHLYCSLPTCR